jgi:hypothetical protein
MKETSIGNDFHFGALFIMGLGVATMFALVKFPLFPLLMLFGVYTLAKTNTGMPNEWVPA